MKLSDKEKKEMIVELRENWVSDKDIKRIIEAYQCEKTYTTEEAYKYIFRNKRNVCYA